jgi:hypothetical protein
MKESIIDLSMAGGLCLTRQFYNGTSHPCGAYVFNSIGPTS